MPSVLKGSYRPFINGGTFKAITNQNTTYHATRPAITGKLSSKVTLFPLRFMNIEKG